MEWGGEAWGGGAVRAMGLALPMPLLSWPFCPARYLSDRGNRQLLRAVGRTLRPGTKVCSNFFPVEVRAHHHHHHHHLQRRARNERAAARHHSNGHPALYTQGWERHLIKTCLADPTTGPLHLYRAPGPGMDGS